MPDIMKPNLLILSAFSDEHLEQIKQGYEVLYAPNLKQRAEAITTNGIHFQAVLTIGSIGLTADEIAAMPKLELICALGAGYEEIDIAAARARGIIVSNGAGTNDACVADHAMGLLLAAVRGIPQLGVALHQGIWRTALPLPASVSFKRLGILGLGTIGKQIARRALGFDMEIGYHSRSVRNDVPFTYFDSLLGLAQWADFLVVATPGGKATRHLVNGPVLDALGPTGVLVNIARGSVVDTEALSQALRQHRIAAAGLDVYESEPLPPQQLMHLPNVVLTPHVAGWSPESVDATVNLFLENANRHFSGQAVLTPV
ncbi:2-hydroxyacid dehydrogenase [Glaciimonas sp. CA11.2]|uniref:2-hydroxyacid dehydrogenase n=2 Tax=Glaciimonas TaxID=1229970 RepID=UPI002AB3E1B2|nr:MULTISPECIES: 2-hydroxyacid dehydrogenase [unclassified Glaciimonas]MDY7546959.1 2-hydroxyacid dehydrogenase [Glaciimonas sp. CA11.2]MEB0011194.1 2-hydroxyacid dehydrogenase [Glaciimonas sp. Cout2]MEB0081129.1 2-hydroxyacid dehydrogenase [Glaciimonas sp. Gout2]MEB0163724.1 2-hydroxyacid dehydrogenase [Glaciimonas sp. CA11.2]